VHDRNKISIPVRLWSGGCMALLFQPAATYIRDKNPNKNDRGEKYITILLHFSTFTADSAEMISPDAANRRH
jgi:hypothetical protein